MTATTWAQMIPLLRKFDVQPILTTRKYPSFCNTSKRCKSLPRAFPQLPLSPRKIICHATSTRSDSTTPRGTFWILWLAFIPLEAQQTTNMLTRVTLNRVAHFPLIITIKPQRKRMRCYIFSLFRWARSSPISKVSSRCIFFASDGSCAANDLWRTQKQLGKVCRKRFAVVWRSSFLNNGITWAQVKR